MSSRYDVVHFSGSDVLISTLKKTGFITDVPTSKNSHFFYFDGYLKDLNTHTVVFEYNYIDKDFLDDYSSYYSKCYENYKKKCCRAHFFKSEFEEKDLVSALEKNGKNEKINCSQYLGFIVFRPIPITLFGRTCLKTYSDSPASYNRDYLSRKYEVNLFGIKLFINTVAFQEQDRAVSACATSALWSAFQCTGIIFHHEMPSPFEITHQATNIFQYTDRNFPSKGLVIPQMIHAIKSVKLDHYVVNFINKDFFLAHIYAFIKGGIPLILGIELTDYKDNGAKKELGLHAVTITGIADKKSKGLQKAFNVKSGIKNENQHLIIKTNNGEVLTPKLFFESSNIDKIYVHDDQLGPYSRMEFDEVTEENRSYYDKTLKTYWAKVNSQFTDVKATPVALLIPLYHKIRIPLVEIIKNINSLNHNINFNLVNSESPQDQKLIWDVYLTTVTNIKSDIYKEELSSNEEKIDFLTKDLPKYMWVAHAHETKTRAFTLLFDATDLVNGKVFLKRLHYNNLISLDYLQFFEKLKKSPIIDSFDEITKIISNN